MDGLSTVNHPPQTLNEVSRGREESVDDQRSTNSEGPLEKKKASDESACDSAMDPSAILHVWVCSSSAL